MSRNAHDLIVTEVISKLYEIYLQRQIRERNLRDGGWEEDNNNTNDNTRARVPMNLKNTRIINNNNNNNNNNENIQFQIISENTDKK
jgi:hypothetical protein